MAGVYSPRFQFRPKISDVHSEARFRHLERAISDYIQPASLPLGSYPMSDADAKEIWHFTHAGVVTEPLRCIFYTDDPILAGVCDRTTGPAFGVGLRSLWGARGTRLWASVRTIPTEIGLPELVVSGFMHQIRWTASDMCMSLLYTSRLSPAFIDSC